MQEPAIFQIVDGAGTVHHSRLTSAQCDAFMTVMLGGGQFPGLRSERMDAAAPASSDTGTPAIAAAFAAEQAYSKALSEIEPGAEREVLQEAIDAHGKASECLERARQVVERAKAFVDARKLELDVLTAARDNEIEASGANLAEMIKTGGPVLEAYRCIDSRAVANAERAHQEASAALDHLKAEQDAADTAYTSAESAVRLAIMAVKRSDVDAMTKRLIDVKAEYMALASAVDAARFSDVPTTQEALEALRIEAPHAGHIDAAAKRWHAYSTALREDPQATWEAQQ
ncbi:hypothetical protein [Paraburkholderia caledonica]|uniref:Uncharacterized protein n=1 Tax=Paraburkholderia caledonica TaxID=134536 RepID=A0ABU1L290_9BURK|nr:hypothetical protein [Paraburkholderia caledonica]MDR6377320.1 hypothetical protein [Paraburkholderia caledonica]